MSCTVFELFVCGIQNSKKDQTKVAMFRITHKTDFGLLWNHKFTVWPRNVKFYARCILMQQAFLCEFRKNTNAKKVKRIKTTDLSKQNRDSKLFEKLALDLNTKTCRI